MLRVNRFEPGSLIPRQSRGFSEWIPAVAVAAAIFFDLLCLANQ